MTDKRQFYKTTDPTVIKTITQKNELLRDAIKKAIEFARSIHPEAVAIGGARWGNFGVSRIQLPYGVSFSDLPAEKGLWKKNGTPYARDKETTKAFNSLSVRFPRPTGLPYSISGIEDRQGQFTIYFPSGELVNGIALLDAQIPTDTVGEPWEPITAAEYYTIKGE